jgi:hypothetical protein
MQFSGDFRATYCLLLADVVLLKVDHRQHSLVAIRGVPNERAL